MPMNQATAGASRLEKLVPLLEFDPDNLPLHRECVELAMQGGEYARALDLVDARLTRHPAEAESLFARANALIALKQYADALPLLKSLEDQGVALLSVAHNLATCHYALQQFENARAYAERVLASGDKPAMMLHVAISSMHYLGDLEPAAKIADENLAIAESNGALAGVCAMLFLDLSQVDKAARLAAVALAKNPNSVDGLIVQATIASAEMENEQAVRQYSRVLELAPRNGRAWLGLGMQALLAMDFAKAKEMLARATEYMPTHIGSWHALGWANLFSGDGPTAEKHFAHALEMDRNFAESHGAMAAMMAMRGDRAGAEREIEIAERLDRTGMSSQFARAILIEREQGTAASREHILRNVQLLSRRFPGKAGAMLAELAGRGSQPRPKP